MDEKTIITGKTFGSSKLAALIWGGGAAVSFAIFYILSDSHRISARRNLLSLFGADSPEFFDIFDMDTFEFLFSSYNSDYVAVLWILILVAFVVGLLASYVIKDSKIVLTNKRIYGNAIFGKRVDIPFNTISGVSSNSMGVTVLTPSGKVTFVGITNGKEIHTAISEALINDKMV